MRKVRTVSGFVALFAASAAFGYFSQAPSSQLDRVHGGPESTAIWNHSALAPAELAKQAEVVVRAQVVDQAEPFIVTPEPFLDPAVANSVIAQGRPIPQLPFTASEFEILEVYSGKVSVGDRIQLMQTGGIIKGEKSEISDDPLYQVGTEHVLFLRDVSSEMKQPQALPVLVTLNPASRYRVIGSQLEAQSSFFAQDPAAAPLELASLEAEIRAAITKPSDLTQP
ncbi:MAG: hypothetical protein K0U98_27410 [Deltaproteobacteria bacterium]|nr:hypothetical protein [Deltaproteobacteria bacterium]